MRELEDCKSADDRAAFGSAAGAPHPVSRKHALGAKFRPRNDMNRSILRRGFYTVYYPVSRGFLKLERLVSWREVRHWVDHTPPGLFTGISFDNYTWWIYNQGLFSGIIASFSNRTNLKILD